MSNAGRAVFEAVGNFRGLQREANKTADALDRTKTSAQQMGQGLPGQAEEKQIANVGQRAQELGGQMQKTGAKMTLGLTTPIALFGASAIKTFANFEQALVSASLKAGANEEQLKRMQKLAVELGASTKFSATESAVAMDQLAAAGFDAEQTIAALPGVMLGAQASGEDLALTADTVAKAINAFGLEASQAGEVSDVFAQAANTTALGMQEIAQGMANAGEVGARFDQDLTGVTAALGRLVDQGVPAASAGVAIRQALSSLSTASPKAKAQMEALGIQVRDTNGEMKQLPEILTEFEQGLSDTNPAFREAAKAAGLTKAEYRDLALKGMLPTVEAQKLVSLAMSDGKPVMLDVIKDGKKLVELQQGLSEVMGDKQAEAWIKARTEQGKFTATGADTVVAIDAMGRASEGLSKKFAKVYGQTTSAKLDELGGSFENIKIALIDSVAPALTTVLEVFTKVLNGFGKLASIPGFGPLIVGAALLVAALGPVLVAVGSVLKAFGRIKAFKAGLGKKGAAAGAGPVVGGGGGGTGGAVFWNRPMPVYLTKPIPGGPAGKGAGKGGAGGVIATGAGGGKKPKGGRGGGFGRAAGGAGAAGAAGGLFAGLSGGGAGEIAKSVALFAGIELAIMGIGKAAAKIGPFLARLGGMFKALATGVRIALTVFRLLSLALLTNPFTLIIAAVILLAVIIVKYWSQIKAFLITAWNAIKAAASAVWNAIKTAVVAGGSAIWAGIKMYIGMVLAFWRMVWNVVKAVAVAVWNTIKSVIGAGIRFVMSIIRAVLGTIRAVWSAAWNAIKAVLSAIWNGIKTVVSAAINFVKGVIQRGVATIKSIWNGLKELGGVVRDAFGAVKDAVGGAIDWCINKVKDFLGVIGKIGGAISGAVKGIGKLGGKVVGALPGLRTGGLVGGTGKGDKYPHLLEAGEFVVRSAVVRQPGVLQTLQRMNSEGAAGISTANLTGRRAALHAKNVGGEWSRMASAGMAQQMSGTTVGAGVNVPAMAGASPVNRSTTKHVTWAPVIQNPSPEPASTSLYKTAQKVAYLGLDGAEDE